MQKFQFHKIEGVGSFNRRLSYDARCVAGDALYVSITQSLDYCPLQMNRLVFSKSKLTSDIDYSGNVKNKTDWFVRDNHSGQKHNFVFAAQVSENGHVNISRPQSIATIVPLETSEGYDNKCLLQFMQCLLSYIYR